MWNTLTDFLSRMLPESWLKKVLDAFLKKLEMRAPGAWARDLLWIALITILVGLCVDAWLYWSKKEHRALLYRRWKALQRFFARFRRQDPQAGGTEGEPEDAQIPAPAQANDDANRAPAEAPESFEAVDSELRQTEETLSLMEEDLEKAAQSAPQEKADRPLPTFAEWMAERKETTAERPAHEAPTSTEPMPQARDKETEKDDKKAVSREITEELYQESAVLAGEENPEEHASAPEFSVQDPSAQDGEKIEGRDGFAAPRSSANRFWSGDDAP